MHKKILAGVLAFLVVGLLVILFLVLARSRHEREGDLAFERDKYHDAVEKYSRALDSTRFFAKGRIDYKIGLCYEHAGDKERAMDMYYAVLKGHPASTYSDAAEKRLAEMFHEAARPPADLSDVLRESTPLGRARKDLRIQFRGLMRSIRENKAGVSGDLRDSFDKYRLSYRIYRQEYRSALEAHKEGVRARALRREEAETDVEVRRLRERGQPGRLGEDGGLPEALSGGNHE